MSNDHYEIHGMSPEDLALYQYEQEMAQAEAQRGEEALTAFLRQVFDLDLRIAKVTVGSVVNEDRGTWRSFLWVTFDGPNGEEWIFPNDLPEEGTDAELDRVCGVLDGFDMDALASTFGRSMPVDDEASYERQAVVKQ